MLPNDWLTRSGGTDKTTHIIAQLLARRVSGGAAACTACPGGLGQGAERSVRLNRCWTFFCPRENLCFLNY